MCTLRIGERLLRTLFIRKGTVMAPRNYRIDNVKGVLIILVVIGHFLLPISTTRFTTNSQYLIYTFHMPCFIFISGYLAKGVYRDGRFKWGKLARLAWLYLLFELGVHVTEGLLEGQIGWRVDLFHESGAPWYLLALLIWYLFVPLCSRLGKWASLALALAVGLAGGYAGSGLGDFLAADRVFAFAPFFFMGYFFTGRELKGLCSGGRRAAAVILGALVGAGIFLGTYDFLEPYRLAVYGAMYDRFSPELYSLCWLIRLICYGAAGALSFGLIAFLPDRRLPFLTKLGQRTLSVYVLHRLIRDLCQYFDLYRFLNVHSKAQVLLMMAGCVALSAVLAWGPVYGAFQWLSEAPFAVWEKVTGKKR